VFIPKPKPIGITPNQTCVLCEFVIHLLQAVATANSTAQELAQILENICKEMPTVLRDECKSFIETYGLDIIALLVREFDPAKICELIKLCPKPKDVAFLTKPNQHTCGLCDYVSTYLSAGYPIENVCKYFSTNQNVKQQCEILVHLYKPNFCSQLPLCFDEAVPQPIEHPIETIINSAECSLCKYIVSYIDAVVQTNKSEAAIEAALEKVCTILPGALKDKCVQFVDTYGPILAQLIAKYATPEEVCNALKACTNGTQTSIPCKYYL
jgi:saposin